MGWKLVNVKICINIYQLEALLSPGMALQPIKNQYVADYFIFLKRKAKHTQNPSLLFPLRGLLVLLQKPQLTWQVEARPPSQIIVWENY